MATTFYVKQQDIALFDVVDDWDLLRAAFGQQVQFSIPVEVPDEALDHISDAVGLDAEDDINAMSRFVGGRWRQHADRPGPSTMGNFGEVLTYIRLKAQGKSPLRVVTYKQGSADADEDDFPMPDYLIEDEGASGCVEVKTSCSLDYPFFAEIVTGDNKRRHSQMAPCNLIPGRWKAALRQLGHADDNEGAPNHLLVLRDQSVVPFPSTFGVAHIHLVHDRRIDALRAHENAARMKTPPDCIDAQRNCWQCMEAVAPAAGAPSVADVITLNMHNAPNKLVLLGSGSEQTRFKWRSAYEGWSRGLWARDPVLTRQADEALVSETEEWLAALDLPREQDQDASTIVRGEWDRYLGRLASSRGMRMVGVRERFAPGRMKKGLEREQFVASREPEVEIADSVGPDWFGEVARRRVRVARGRFGVTTSADEEVVELRAAPNGAMKMDQESATDLMASLVRMAVEIFHGVAAADLPGEVLLREVQEIRVRYGDDSHSFGWRLNGTLGFASVVVMARLAGSVVPCGTSWTMALGQGDPRVALGAYPDGRAYLRFPRSLHLPFGLVRFT